jgi:hypothetical protein
MTVNGSTLMDISHPLIIPISNTYKILAKLAAIKFNIERITEITKRRGRKAIFINEKMRSISQIVSDDSSLTQKGMKNKLADTGYNISQSTISNYLRKLSITRKRLVVFGDKRNDAEIIGKRQSYAIKYYGHDSDDFLFLDETGLNLRSKRSF